MPSTGQTARPATGRAVDRFELLGQALVAGAWVEVPARRFETEAAALRALELARQRYPQRRYDVRPIADAASQ